MPASVGQWLSWGGNLCAGDIDSQTEQVVVVPMRKMPLVGEWQRHLCNETKNGTSC